MKQWFVWLLGVITGMQVLVYLNDSDSFLLQIAGSFTSTMGVLGVLISIILNIIVLVAVLSKTWDLEEF